MARRVFMYYEQVAGRFSNCPNGLRGAIGRAFFAVSLEAVVRHGAYTIVVAFPPRTEEDRS